LSVRADDRLFDRLRGHNYGRETEKAERFGLDLHPQGWPGVGDYEANGKKRHVYGKTKKDVAAKLAKAIADRDEGLVYDSEKLTVEAYLDKWLDTIRDTLE